VKFRFWVALIAELALLASLNLFDDWALQLMPLKFVAAAIACGLAYLLATAEFDATAKNAVALFWVITIALRLLALPLEPANEVWRYQADGAMQRVGLNPYKTSPMDAGDRIKVADIARVPRNDEPAAYAPGAEILFRAVPSSESALFYKIIFAAADLLAVALLLRLVNVRTGAWFAWNPLIVYTFAGAAHFDSIVLLAIVTMLATLRWFEESGNIKSRYIYAIAAAIALGLAISLRPIMIVLLLPAAFALRGYAVTLLLGILAPLVAGVAVGIPSFGHWNFFGDYAQVSRLNDLSWWILEDTLWPNWHQQHYRYDVVIIVVSTIIAFVFVRNWKRGMLWSLGAAIILAPVLHAWYVTWILPLATWRRAFGWHLLSVTIFAYYLFFNQRGVFAMELPWHADPWLRGMIILPVVFAMVMLARQRLLRKESS
jgi:hypothetical protein